MSWFKKLLGAKEGNQAGAWYQEAMGIFQRGQSGRTGEAELERGIQLCRKARNAYRSSNPGGSRHEALCLNLEASIHKLRPNLEAAIECYHASYEILHKVEPHSEQEALSLNNLAEGYRSLYKRGEKGDLGPGTLLIKALDYALQAHELYKTRYQTYTGYIHTLHTIGMICRDFGDVDAAESLFSMAAKLFALLGNNNSAPQQMLVDLRKAKGQYAGHNLIREKAFRYLGPQQKQQAEILLKQAREIA